MKRYSIIDTDNSCCDPECCSGPFPYNVAKEDINGEFINAREYLESLGFKITLDDENTMLIEFSELNNK